MGLVLSLCDRTGNMVRPWIEAGHEAVTVDIQNASGEPGRWHYACDVREMPGLLREKRFTIVFAFPPCTHLAVSGARWFQSKGMGALIEALQIVEACRVICEESGAPYMIENPVSTLSTYWRKPDHSFHPWQYAGLCPDDNYTKKTCLWTGGGFVMPDPRHDHSAGLPDDRIHKAPPSEARADFRSATPMGFARAVFEANHPTTGERTNGRSADLLDSRASLERATAGAFTPDTLVQEMRPLRGLARNTLGESA